MSEHKAWLDEWIAKRVRGAPFQEQKRMAKEAYSPGCVEAARQVGITRGELDEAAGGQLLAYLEVAIEDKWDIEVRKNLPVKAE